MAVGFLVDCFFYEVGTPDFLHAFFSTISFHLEKEGWGSKYPHLMNELYQGKLNWADVPKAMKEVKEIQGKLLSFTPSEIVWDLDDLSKKPPWGDDISPEISNLANYFVTSDGEQIFDVLCEALGAAHEEKCDLVIRKL